MAGTVRGARKQWWTNPLAFWEPIFLGHRQFQSGGIKGIRGKKRDCRRTVPGKVMENILEEEAFALGIDV